MHVPIETKDFDWTFQEPFFIVLYIYIYIKLGIIAMLVTTFFTIIDIIYCDWKNITFIWVPIDKNFYYAPITTNDVSTYNFLKKKKMLALTKIVVSLVLFIGLLE